VDINEAVREVIELTQGEAAKNGVSMLTVLDDGLPLVPGDRVQLQQVMLNLIVNAVEAMSAMSMGPRELLISTAADSSNGVSIAVRDSGPGLPPVEIKRVFDPFYTTKAHGLGMGLSICRSIVETHGGRLWASANAPRGAVFQLILPLEEIEHAPSSENDGLPVA
jgi:signal transduction histidine kinase